MPGHPIIHHARCENCGFLHGVASSGVSRDDIYFDPTTLREAKIAQDSGLDTVLTSYTYQRREVNYEFKTPTTSSGLFDRQRVETTVSDQYTWRFTDSIGCYRRVWNVMPWHERQLAPQALEQINTEVHRDRQCRYYYPYSPGLSVTNHVHDQLEQERTNREIELAQTLARQSSLIQWIAIGISLLSISISALTSLLPGRDAAPGNAQPIPVVVVTPTPRPAPTVAPSDTPAPTSVENSP